MGFGAVVLFARRRARVLADRVIHTGGFGTESVRVQATIHSDLHTGRGFSASTTLHVAYTSTDAGPSASPVLQKVEGAGDSLYVLLVVHVDLD